MDDAKRLLELERGIDALAQRVQTLELVGGVAARRSQDPPPPARRPDGLTRPAPRSPLRPSYAPPVRRQATAEPGGEGLVGLARLEDLFAGRVLAWIGGLSIGIGVILLFVLAVSAGWIGPTMRVVIAGMGSLALLSAGIWLHEQRGRTDAAQAAAASAIASLFATVAVAARVYDVISVEVGLCLGFAVGATALALAIRWNGRGIGALGLLGGLLAPVLVGAPQDTATIALLFVATASIAAVLVWKQWDWLAFGAFAIASPQWINWLWHATELTAIAALVLFGAIGVAAAVGFELRRGGAELRASSAFLLVLNALTSALAGSFALGHLGHPFAAKLWLVSLALAHLTAGLLCLRLDRTSDHLSLLALGIAVALADVALGELAHGTVLALVWAAAGMVFAWLARRSGGRAMPFALAGVGTQLGLALLRGTVDASRADQAGGNLTATVLTLASLAAACFVSGLLTDSRSQATRAALHGVALGTVAYLNAVALDGAQLVIAWALESAALIKLGRRYDDRVASLGSLAFLGAATVEALIVVPVHSLIYGLTDPVSQAAALLVIALVAAGASRVRVGGRDLRVPAFAYAGTIVLYLASAALVTPFQPSGSDAGNTLLDVGIRQEGQVLMSALWALAGVGGAIFGLRRNIRAVRIGALALLFASVGKVFLFDLATLSSIYRVVSFIALGLLLLVGAFTWQRKQPTRLPDLRVAE